MSEHEIDQLAERLATRLLARVKTHISPAEFAQARGVALRTVYRHIANGSIPAKRVGRRVLIEVGHE